MGNLRLQTPTKRIQRARAKLMEALKREAADLTGEEILALLSYSVGQCIAVQDQRSMTPSQAMEIVSANISQGNADAIAATFGNTRGTA